VAKKEVFEFQKRAIFGS